MSKISGESLLGFGDYFSDVHLVGAGKGKPGKTVPYGKPKHNPDVHNHGLVLGRASQTAAHALQTVQGAQRVLARGVKGGKVHLGAAAGMTAKQRAAVQRHNAAVARAQQFGKLLAQHVARTRGALAVLSQKMVTQKRVAQSLRAAHRGHTALGLLSDPVIGEEVRRSLVEYYTAVGADPDPANPGFLTDGSPDPAMTSAGPAADALPPLSDGHDTGAALPPAPDMGQFIPDMVQAGGLAYHGEKGAPDGYVVSYGLATRKTDYDSGVPKTAGIDPVYHYGYVWGKYHDEGPEKGIPFGDNMNSGRWGHLRGRWILGHFRKDAGSGHADTDNTDGYTDQIEPAEAFASNTKLSSGSGPSVSYGPLVGNPAMPDFKGMRVDAQGNMFWLPQEAPDWLTWPIKQAAALTAQAAAKAKAAADAADAAAAAKVKADQMAAQAAQDAANALSESQATSQAKVAQTTSDSQAAVAAQAAQSASQQAEAQGQQTLADQARADAESQAAQAGQERQAGDLLIQQAKRVQQYYEQHPEEEFGPPGGGQDDRGGVGPLVELDADGLPIPGAESMHDADGEGYQEDDGGSGGGDYEDAGAEGM